MRLSLGLALLALLLLQTDRAQLLQVLQTIDPLAFLLALLVGALGNALRAVKWRQLLRALGAEVSFGELHRLTYMALFFNNFLPGALGGDSFRVYRTLRLVRNAGDATAVVILDRLTGLVTLVAVAGAAATAELTLGTTPLPASMVLQVLLAAAGVLLLCLLAPSLASRMPPLKSRLPGRMGALLDQLALAFRELHAHPTAWRQSLVLSGLSLGTMIVSKQCFALSAAVPVSLLALALIVPLASFVVLVPISFNGLGLQEGLFVLFFRLIGVEPTSAFVLALLPRVGLLLYSLLGGAIYLLEKKDLSWSREGA